MDSVVFLIRGLYGRERVFARERACERARNIKRDGGGGRERTRDAWSSWFQVPDAWGIVLGSNYEYTCMYLKYGVNAKAGRGRATHSGK